MFPRTLSLWVTPKSNVADVTYGQGVFWRRAPDDRYKELATDLQDGTDYTAICLKMVCSHPGRNGFQRVDYRSCAPTWCVPS